MRTQKKVYSTKMIASISQVTCHYISLRKKASSQIKLEQLQEARGAVHCLRKFLFCPILTFPNVWGRNHSEMYFTISEERVYSTHPR